MTRMAAIIVFLIFVGLILVGWRIAGAPTKADGRMASEPWRLLSIAPLGDDRFLISAGYISGDIRTYLLNLRDPRQRDIILKAMGDLKMGKRVMGRAQHGRAGLMADDQMDFSFTDAPDLQPKDPSP